MPGVGPLHQQQLTLVVADDGADGDLRRDVAGDPAPDRLHPFGHDLLVLGLFDRSHADVGRDGQHLFEPLLLVPVVGEGQTGPADAGEGLAPSEQLTRGRALLHHAEGTG